MQIGLHVTSFAWPGGADRIGETLASIGRTADDAGFASISVMDHFFQMEQMGGPAQPMLEAYAALAYLAAAARRARLGALVTGVVYRHPAVLVKTVTALDVLSGGRAFFGIGAAWYEREARGLGIPFPPVKERFERLEETLRIARHMWSGASEPYRGKHYQLAEPLNLPQPTSRPYPPILIGGGGEQKTLRLVARYADACNLFASAGPEALRHKLEVLKRHCDALNRPYDEIEKTALAPVDFGRPDAAAALIAQCRELAGLGFQRLIVMLPDVHELRSIERIGRDVIPVVAEFEPA
jgi:F420-dependent oxidoreductase-like protein